MKKITAIVAVLVIGILFTGYAYAEPKGTKAEAESLVKKAVAYLKANGRDKAFAEFSNPKGKFVDKDLYVFVYDMNGKCLAHGGNQRMIGKDLLDLTDADGKEFVKERIQIAKTKGSGWQSYKFSNPADKKIEDKTAYIEKCEDVIIGCGAYKER